MPRQSFPQGQGAPLLVEIDLESGVTPYGSSLKLMRGAQSVGLRTATNAIWQPRYRGYPAFPLPMARHGLGFPAMPIINNTRTFFADYPSHVLGFLTMPAYLNRQLLVTRLAASPYNIQVFRDNVSLYPQTIYGNSGTDYIGTTSDSLNTGYPIVQAYWRTADLNHEARDLDGDGNTTDAGEAAVSSYTSNGIMFFSHPASDHIYMVDTNGAVDSNSGSGWYIRSYTTINSDADYHLHMDAGSVAAPAGVSALKIHLDRLWMAELPAGFRATSTSGRYTTLWYTDPSNWRQIRPENFITIEDEVRALATPTTGGIGTGGQAQLVIFGVDTITVLDGDPEQGNTFQRLLANNVGVASQKSVVETPYGIVFVSTDAQVYILPPGAQRLIPIGEAILSEITGYNADTISSTQPAIQLYWAAPYVYVVSGNLYGSYIFDLSKPDSPKWWGPLQGDYASPVVGETFPNQLESSSLNRTSFYTHKPVSNTIKKIHLDMIQANPSLTGLTSSFQTGVMNVPGHRIQLDKVFIQQFAATSLPTISVSAYTAEGNTYTGVQYGHQPAGPISGSAIDNSRWTRTISFSFGNNLPASDSIYLNVSGPSGSEPRIHKAYALIRVQPASW